jgi:hypothetical protein
VITLNLALSHWVVRGATSVLDILLLVRRQSMKDQRA